MVYTGDYPILGDKNRCTHCFIDSKTGERLRCVKSRNHQNKECRAINKIGFTAIWLTSYSDKNNNIPIANP
jgi:hypothetical protein